MEIPLQHILPFSLDFFLQFFLHLEKLLREEKNELLKKPFLYIF